MRFVAILFGVCLVAAASGAGKSIVGVWYEEATYGGSHVISILNIKTDGTYEAVYRRCLPEGQVADSTSMGRWSYAEGRLRMTTADLAGRYSTDEYETESNDGKVWVYRGVAGEGFWRYGAVRFRDVRVGPESKLPTCDLSS